MRLLLALTFVAVAGSAEATTVLHQTITTKKEGKPERVQATVTYLDGERFRVERFPGTNVKDPWVALIVFDGKQTYNCRRSKQNTCRATTGGPLSELDAVIGQPGMKVSVTSFAFTPQGAAKKVGGESCKPHKLDMEVNAELELGGLKLPGGFKPAVQAKVTGVSCVGDLPDWKPAALAAQLASSKSLFATTAAYDSFVAAAKLGAGFELEGSSTVKGNVGGGTALPDLNSSGSKTTTKVEKKMPALTAEQLKIPAGFTLTK